MENSNKDQDRLTEEELAIVTDVTTKVREGCVKSKYSHLCEYIKTDNGLAYVVNRCIKSMSQDKIKFSTALANLENEMEGMD